jgi:hypothetical protein
MPQTSTYDEFMARYNPDGTHPVTEIEVAAGDARDTSPFIVIRQGGRIVVVNPLPFEEYLDVDLHAFDGGRDAAMGVLGFLDGRRHTLGDTGLTRHGWPALGLVAVLVGEPDLDPEPPDLTA